MGESRLTYLRKEKSRGALASGIIFALVVLETIISRALPAPFHILVRGHSSYVCARSPRNATIFDNQFKTAAPPTRRELPRQRQSP